MQVSTMKSKIFKATSPSLVSGSPSPVKVYLASLAPGSKATMHSALSVLVNLLTGKATDADTFPWHELRYEHTSALRAELMERYSAATANKMMSALRGVLQQARRLHLMTSGDYMEATDLDSIRGETLPAGREIKSNEIASLLGACANDPSPARAARDAAIIAVLRATGIRRAELCSVTMADFDQTAQTFTIHGKRNKRRTVYISKAAAQLSAWLIERGDKPGPLFCRITKGGKPLVNLTHGLRAASINYIFDQREKQAGLKKHATPHDFRRTMIGGLLGAGVDIVTVQHLAGHEDVSTTARYDRRGEDDKRKAAAKVELPMPDLDGISTAKPKKPKAKRKSK